MLFLFLLTPLCLLATYTKINLDKGTSVSFHECDIKKHAIGICIETDSKNYNRRTNHLIEHLICTQKCKDKLSIFEWTYSKNGSINGSTFEKQIIIYANISPEFMPEFVQRFYLAINSPKLDKDLIESEKEVVLSEEKLLKECDFKEISEEEIKPLDANILKDYLSKCKKSIYIKGPAINQNIKHQILAISKNLKNNVYIENVKHYKSKSNITDKHSFVLSVKDSAEHSHFGYILYKAIFSNFFDNKLQQLKTLGLIEDITIDPIEDSPNQIREVLVDLNVTKKGNKNIESLKSIIADLLDFACKNAVFSKDKGHDLKFSSNCDISECIKHSRNKIHIERHNIQKNIMPEELQSIYKIHSKKCNLNQTIKSEKICIGIEGNVKFNSFLTIFTKWLYKKTFYLIAHKYEQCSIKISPTGKKTIFMKVYGPREHLSKLICDIETLLINKNISKEEFNIAQKENPSEEAYSNLNLAIKHFCGEINKKERGFNFNNFITDLNNVLFFEIGTNALKQIPFVKNYKFKKNDAYSCKINGLYGSSAVLLAYEISTKDEEEFLTIFRKTKKNIMKALRVDNKLHCLNCVKAKIDGYDYIVITTEDSLPADKIEHIVRESIYKMQPDFEKDNIRFPFSPNKEIVIISGS